MTKLATQTVLDMAARPQGVGLADLADLRLLSREACWSRLNWLRLKGTLVQAKPQHGYTRWFTQQAAADAWLQDAGMQAEGQPMAVRALVELRRLQGQPLTAAALASAQGGSRDSAGRALRELRGQGQVVSRRVGDLMAYFLDDAAAGAWRGELRRAAKAPRPSRTSIRRAARLPADAERMPARPRDLPAPLVRQTIMPDGLRVTVCPSVGHDPRYQVDPRTRPAGAGFAAAGIGRYLPDA